MHFEHLVEINDPETPEIPDLTAEEVWFGLLCRAEDPRPFLPGLDACEILTRCEERLTRRLEFGQVCVVDAVCWQAMEWIRFESAATDSHPGGTLTISLEQPVEAPGALFLRFTYRTGLEADQRGEVDYADYVRSAYHASDLDTVRVIRMIAESTRTE